MKILCSFLLVFCATLHAEITLDGTLGHGSLPGPDYRISADMGQQHGGNLFHSFGEFTVFSHESATFSGPDSVQNIISRVTGGNSSVIDGTLRSVIADADLYLLNPNGVMFGPNARLEVQGGFHASTADYLRLGDDTRFYAEPAALPNLSVAPPAAFGFLTDSPAPVTAQNSHLAVPEGKTLSLIGGDLHLSGESPVLLDFVVVSVRSKLSAQAGRINLAGVASKGEVIPREFELEQNAEGGNITLDNTLIETSGRGAGAVFIRGGQLVMRDAAIQNNTLADQDGQGIDMRLSESVDISGYILAVLGNTFGSGKGSDLTIVTPDLEITGSVVYITSSAQGDAGDIKIKTARIEVKQGGYLGSYAYGQGKGADVHIDVDESVFITGQNDISGIFRGVEFTNAPSTIITDAYSGQGGNLIVNTNHLNMAGGILGTSTVGKGDSGNVMVRANTISISEGGMISSGSLNKGKAGNIVIVAGETLSVSGRRDGLFSTGDASIKVKDNQSSIVSFGLQSAGGDISISARTLRIDNEAVVSASTLGMAETAGNIDIDTENLTIAQGGQINNSNGVFLGKVFFAGPGQGGSIQIKAKNITIAGSGLPSGIFSDTFSSGEGGDVKIETDSLTVSDGGAVSARSSDTGNAGQVSVRADTVRLSNQGEISTEAGNAAGGNISMNTPGLLYLHEGKITATVGAGKGRGGDITIENPDFTVLNKGQIKARADEGRGGDIRIISGNFLKTGDSIISASSRAGIDGRVDLASPDTDVAGGLMALPPAFLNAGQWLQTPCAAAIKRSSFVAAEIKGVPKPAGALLSGGPLLMPASSAGRGL
ncbi:MAG: filamentous hemagglutinin N-terminal domain-containing protein [Gammaproteobacteria bacterium]|nr:filamentous hemagglutinin N-terminal domain-containing protein [Gammaproteobacteria bacterium]